MASDHSSCAYVTHFTVNQIKRKRGSEEEKKREREGWGEERERERGGEKHIRDPGISQVVIVLCRLTFTPRHHETIDLIHHVPSDRFEL